MIDRSLNEIVEKKKELARKKFNIPTDTQNSADIALVETAGELARISANKPSARRISIQAPIGSIFAKLRLKGYIHPVREKAVGNMALGFHTDQEIISHYNARIRGILN